VIYFSVNEESNFWVILRIDDGWAILCIWRLHRIDLHVLRSCTWL